MRRSETTAGVSESSQNPLKCSCPVKALVKDVVANHNDHEGCRSEAPPGNVVHQSDMVPEGEAQPDNPEPLVLLEVHEGQKIACGFMLASVSKITLDLPWRPARAGWQQGEVREKKG